MSEKESGYIFVSSPIESIGFIFLLADIWIDVESTLSRNGNACPGGLHLLGVHLAIDDRLVFIRCCDYGTTRMRF